MSPGRSRHRLAWLLAAAALTLTLFPAAAGAATVTKTVDTDDGTCDADCSLREAIEAAAPGETVTVPASSTPYEVLDANGSLLITKDLTVAGAGARQTEVTAPGSSARPFTILSDPLESVDVVIRDLSVTGGGGFGGGYGAQGGGVLVSREPGSLLAPSLLLERARVEGNLAISSGGQAVGGGVLARGEGTRMTIRDSLIAENVLLGNSNGQATGGGVASFAKATAAIENTTIYKNFASASGAFEQSSAGGGAFLLTGSSVVNSTFRENRATGIGMIPGRGGNLGGGATIRNTILSAGIADEAGTEDCLSPITAQSQGGNVVPPSCGPTGADRAAEDAGLGPLADNGGETDTPALLDGSPAIDAGVDCPPPATDQRGEPRPSGAACDAGAFEVQVPAPPAPPQETTPPPTCNGRSATIVGTAKRDRLTGTGKRDVIAALAGNDTIRALAGTDLVCAGKGRDVVRGGRGRDRLLGQQGADRLFGGPGKDKLLGGAGKDRQVQ